MMMIDEEILKRHRNGMSHLLVHHHHLVVGITLEHITQSRSDRMTGKHLMASTHRRERAAETEADEVTKTMIKIEFGTETEVETGIKSTTEVEAIRSETLLSEVISVRLNQSDPKVEAEAEVEVLLHFLVVRVDIRTNIQKVTNLNHTIQAIVALQLHQANEICHQ